MSITEFQDYDLQYIQKTGGFSRMQLCRFPGHDVDPRPHRAAAQLARALRRIVGLGVATLASGAQRDPQRELFDERHAPHRDGLACVLQQGSYLGYLPWRAW